MKKVFRSPFSVFRSSEHGGWGMKKVFRSPFSVFRSSEDGLGVRKLVASLKPET
jgi:hypothetical protein